MKFETIEQGANYLGKPKKKNTHTHTHKLASVINGNKFWGTILAS